jgi:hypothetical protein
MLFLILKNNVKKLTEPKNLLAESRTRSLSLKRFAVLLKLCKADNQPRRLQDKTGRFNTVPIKRNTFFNGFTKPLEIDTKISIKLIQQYQCQNNETQRKKIG